MLAGIALARCSLLEVLGGGEAVLGATFCFFCVQVADAKSMEIATEIDPNYSQTLSRAIDLGLEVMVWRAKLSPREISLDSEILFIQARQGPGLSS